MSSLMPAGDVATLPEAFQSIWQRHPDAIAIRTVGGDRQLSWRDYAQQVEVLAAGLAGVGVRHGTTVALMLTNRPEFHLLDTAALHLGAIPFSVYNTSSPEQIAYLLGNAAATVMVTEPQFIEAVRESGASLKHLVCLDDSPDDTLSLADLIAAATPSFDFGAAWGAVAPGDVCTLIYTSGTTGAPKGVELTHANVIAECAAFSAVVDGRPGDRVISYLPTAHVADRMCSHYLQMSHGVATADLVDPRGLAQALAEVRPNVFLAVPRIWDKLRFTIEARVVGAPSPISRRIGSAALALGRSRVAAAEAGRSLPLHQELLWRVADRVVLAKVRRALGFGDLRVALSGAAAISPDTLRFFAALGIEICEVWGMSETTAGTTINPPGQVKIGTVGKPVPGVELRLADDGEILVRGPIVMRGYRGDPTRTAEVLDGDGWLATGDIATIDKEGYVSIVDRKKELIINAAGKNMSPTNIENTLKSEIPVAASVVVIGEARAYNVALIALDPEAAAEVAMQAGRVVTDAAGLAADPAVLAAVEAGVRKGNARLSRVEQVKTHLVVDGFWLPGGEELTPTLKLRRRPIAEKYAAEIEALYAGDAS